MVMFGEIPESDQNFFTLFCSRTDSEARCIKSGDSISCSTVFRNIPINSDQVSIFLTAKYGDNERTAKRIFAARHFEGNPIGVLDISIQHP